MLLMSSRSAEARKLEPRTISKVLNSELRGSGCPLAIDERARHHGKAPDRRGWVLLDSLTRVLRRLRRTDVRLKGGLGGGADDSDGSAGGDGGGGSGGCGGGGGDAGGGG